MSAAAPRHPNFLRRPPLRDILKSRSSVDAESGCWVWQFGCDSAGYGAFQYDNLNDRAHRHSWRSFRGPIPVGIFVCHTCDNPLCVNPDHLFLGTHADNQRDKRDKGRNVAPGLMGEENPQCRLQDWQVREIRASNLTTSRLARKYSVSTGTISLIRTRKTWRHI